MSYEPLDTLGLDPVARPQPGDEPRLEWVDTDLLVVDTRYQRPIVRAGKRNVVKIASEFRWAMFSPLIVSPVEGGRYAVVDGQHHTVSAMLCGIRRVPCMIVNAGPQQQAAMFAAINGTVTAMSSLQLYHARVASGDEDAQKLDRVLRACGVSVCRYPVPATKMKPGETLSASQLGQLYRRFGTEIFGNALSCITRTRDGHPGLLRAPIVLGICLALVVGPRKWRGQELLNCMQGFDLKTNLREIARDQEGPSELPGMLQERVAKYLAANFK